VFFFFSSRRRHTRFSRDWSSDVCSSDLAIYAPDAPYFELPRVPLGEDYRFRVGIYDGTILLARARSFSFSVDELGIDGSPDLFRSEERRVGKEGRAWWWTGR